MPPPGIGATDGMIGKRLQLSSLRVRRESMKASIIIGVTNGVTSDE